MDLTESTMTWNTSTVIKPEHKDLRYTQVYCWIYTTDQKIILVSKDNKKWQFPGGKPIVGESMLETCYREVNEETSLNLNEIGLEPTFFGYYLIEEHNKETKEKTDEYLQLRFFVKINKSSNELVLATNEREGDVDQIMSVKAFSFVEAGDLIFWFTGSNEFKAFKESAEV